MKIIINRMYAGGYLNLSENMIGHEAINLVETDEGARFIWLNANGKCNQTFDREEDNIVLLVRNVDEAGVVQVIARAKIKGQVLDGMDSSSRYIRESKQPRDRMYYGGKNVYDIFASNRVGHKGEEDTYATFEVEDFRIPKDEMFLTDAEEKKNERGNVYSIRTEKVKHFAKSSLRQFIEYNDAPTYMDDALWYSYNDIPDDRKKLFGTIDNNIQPTLTSQASLFDIIGDTYHELSYSNFLAYFLNQRDILREFAEKVLEIYDLDVENCVISREEYNIDILIQSENYVIVIENKIKSGITEGVKGTTIEKQIHKMFEGEKDSKKLEDSFLVAQGETSVHIAEDSYTLNDILGKTDGVSQLSKYYLYAQKIANGRTVVCFVLAPNYHLHSLGLTNYFYNDKYTILGYGTVKDFFECYSKKNPHSVKFIQDYIDAVNPHSKPFDNYLEDKLLQRFRNAIANGRAEERMLHKQLSFFKFKEKVEALKENIDDELLAKYVMLLRVKHLMFKGDAPDNNKTIEYFSLTEEEINEYITLAGLKYLKKEKKDPFNRLSDATIELICAYGNFKMKFKKVENIEKKLHGTADYMDKTQVKAICCKIGNSKYCGKELYEVFKDFITQEKKTFISTIENIKQETSVEATLKTMIKEKLTKEIEAADEIFKLIQKQ